MAFIFGGIAGDPGIMKVFTGAGTMGTLTFGLGGWTSGASAQNAVLTGISASTQGNYQFLLTLRNFTYVYMFGEKMGDMTVTGIGLKECPVGGTSEGLTAAINYYNTYAISVTGTPVGITFAGFTLWAFLIGGTFSYMDPQNRLSQFQLNFKIISQ
jgi:hypothetical protein